MPQRGWNGWNEDHKRNGKAAPMSGGIPCGPLAAAAKAQPVDGPALYVRHAGADRYAGVFGRGAVSACGVSGAESRAGAGALLFRSGGCDSAGGADLCGHLLSTACSVCCRRTTRSTKKCPRPPTPTETATPASALRTSWNSGAASRSADRPRQRKTAVYKAGASLRDAPALLTSGGKRRMMAAEVKRDVSNLYCGGR